MSFFNRAFDILLAGERTLKSPIFLKDFTKENKQLNDLRELSNKVKDGNKKDLVERDIAFLKSGIEGENNVYFELKNSFLPLLCLYDIRLAYEDYVAQLDFVIITNKFICILETKKLSGNIIINSDGDFIRIIQNRYGKEIKREGIYSPISQNERHLRILKDILLKKQLVKTMPFISLVVMANPKTIINKNKCPSAIGKSIYKYDQIVPCLTRHLNDKENDRNVLEKYMYDIANFLINNHNPIEYDSFSKYNLTEDDFCSEKENITTYKDNVANSQQQAVKSCNKRDNDYLRNKLKEFRLLTSKKENIAAYMIFNNEEMEGIISKYPTTSDGLMEVKGFGKKKVDKYGEAILRIFLD